MKHTPRLRVKLVVDIDQSDMARLETIVASGREISTTRSAVARAALRRGLASLERALDEREDSPDND